MLELIITGYQFAKVELFLTIAVMLGNIYRFLGFIGVPKGENLRFFTFLNTL